MRHSERPRVVNSDNTVRMRSGGTRCLRTLTLRGGAGPSTIVNSPAGQSTNDVRNERGTVPHHATRSRTQRDDALACRAAVMDKDHRRSAVAHTQRRRTRPASGSRPRRAPRGPRPPAAQRAWLCGIVGHTPRGYLVRGRGGTSGSVRSVSEFRARGSAGAALGSCS
jgi:hypothetical protein